MFTSSQEEAFGAVALRKKSKTTKSRIIGISDGQSRQRLASVVLSCPVLFAKRETKSEKENDDQLKKKKRGES